MIGKIVLGESLKFLIGELKLSYRKVSTIIGESLAGDAEMGESECIRQCCL